KLLAGFAGSVSSVADLGPMAKTLASVPLTPAQMQMTSTAYAAALTSISSDDRSFSHAVSASGSLLADINALLAACKRQQVSTAALVDAVRGYLARHLGARRCADTGGMIISTGLGNAVPTPPDAVTFFNTTILPGVYPADSVIAPLGGDEIRASSIEDPIQPEEAPKSAELTEITDRYTGLLLNPLGTSWSSEQKADVV